MRLEVHLQILRMVTRVSPRVWLMRLGYDSSSSFTFPKCLLFYSLPIVLSNKVDVANHLDLGKKFLQDGQLSEALMHYSAACGKGSSCASNVVCKRH